VRIQESRATIEFSQYRIEINQGRHFSLFQGGRNFDRLPREGGAKYEKYKSKTQKVTIFQNQGGGGMPPLPCPPPKGRP